MALFPRWNVKSRFCLFVVTAFAFGCSGGNGGNDAGLADVSGDVSADVVGDVIAGDVSDDGGRQDLVGQDVVLPDAVADVAPDTVADAADVDSDEGPQAPWYDQLVPEGQRLNQIVGVASHMETSEAGDAETEFEFDQYLAAGGMRARRGFRWSNVEPAEGEWHWEKTNGAVSRAPEHGVNLIPVVYYGNDWAQADPDVYASLDIAKFANYAGAMATQYCDSIKDYEIWNEQNITRFWHVAPDPEKYADMLIAASVAIKAACPDAKVAFGGMASYDDVDMFDTWSFLRKSLEARPQLCDYFEIVALHPYTFFQFDSPEYDETDFEYAKRGQTWMTQVARDMISDAGCSEKGIYYTELGWPSYDLSREMVASYAARSLLLAARDGVEGWYWYTFYDDDPADASSIRPQENYFGLFEYPGEDHSIQTPKPAWNALMAQNTIVGPGRFAVEVNRVMDLPNDVYVLAFVDDLENLVLAMWDGRNQPDVTYGVTAEGGADTTFTLDLPLPENTTGTTLFDQYGVELSSPGAGPSVQIVLTPSVQYLVVAR